MNIHYLSGADLESLVALAQAADYDDSYLRVEILHDGIKVAKGQGMWTPLLGNRTV